jgi:hypothetical protein
MIDNDKLNHLRDLWYSIAQDLREKKCVYIPVWIRVTDSEQGITGIGYKPGKEADIKIRIRGNVMSYVECSAAQKIESAKYAEALIAACIRARDEFPGKLDQAISQLERLANG